MNINKRCREDIFECSKSFKLTKPFLNIIDEVPDNNDSDLINDYNKINSSSFESTESIEKNIEENNEISDEINCKNININDSVFESEMKLLLDKMVLHQEESENIISKIVHDLNVAVTNINFPFRFCPFGSYKNGLTCKESDIDLSFELLSNDNNNDTSLMKSVFQQIKSDKNKYFNDVIYIRRARIPVIKFKHQATKKHCDVSFFNEVGKRTTLLVKFYLNMNSKLKILVLFLKYLLQNEDLHGTGKITTYILFWLVVYYMQQTDLLPPIINSCQSAEEQYNVLGWDCSVPSRCTIPIDDRFSLYFHFKEFLKFYSNFEFMKFVICPYIASAIPVDCFENLKIPSDSFAVYLEKVEKKNDEKFTPSIINLQDPFIHNFNVTKSVALQSLNRFKLFCHRTYKFLCNNLSYKEQFNILKTKKMLPQKYIIPRGCSQYMTVSWNIKRFSQQIQDLYDQQGITYICNRMRTIMETKFQFRIQCTFVENPERMCQKNYKLEKITTPMCFLSGVKEYSAEEDNAGYKERIKPLTAFIMLEIPKSEKCFRISVESESHVINFLNENLFNLFFDV